MQKALLPPLHSSSCAENSPNRRKFPEKPHSPVMYDPTGPSLLSVAFTTHEAAEEQRRVRIIVFEAYVRVVLPSPRQTRAIGDGD